METSFILIVLTELCVHKRLIHSKLFTLLPGHFTSICTWMSTSNLMLERKVNKANKVKNKNGTTMFCLTKRFRIGLSEESPERILR